MSKLNAGILARLVTECPFPEVFADVERPAGSVVEIPRRKICHLRADHDGYHWWNTVWPCHDDLCTPEMALEIDRTYEALTAKDAFSDLDAMRRFCYSRPEARMSQDTDDEYGFYLVGETCDFWVRLILRRRDYNIYLNAYARGRSDDHR